MNGNDLMIVVGGYTIIIVALIVRAEYRYYKEQNKHGHHQSDDNYMDHTKDI